MSRANVLNPRQRSALGFYTNVTVHGPPKSPFAPRKQRCLRGAKGDFPGQTPAGRARPVNACTSPSRNRQGLTNGRKKKQIPGRAGRKSGRQQPERLNRCPRSVCPPTAPSRARTDSISLSPYSPCLASHLILLGLLANLRNGYIVIACGVHRGGWIIGASPSPRPSPGGRVGDLLRPLSHFAEVAL